MLINVTGEIMTKENKSLKTKTSSRRKFFKTAAKAGAVAAATVAMPNIARADGHVTLKMQAAWPSGANIFFEMAGDYCKMVSDMSGGTLKIDLQPVGAVVKTSEIGQAVSSGVVDMGHWVTAYWYGKNACCFTFWNWTFIRNVFSRSNGMDGVWWRKRII
jgi:TRAP-type mannitol/chloroaromatic compound transport system substrate-binding protein